MNLNDTLLNHDWRWRSIYYIRSEDGIKKIRRRPEQLLLTNTLYTAFFGGYREEVIVLKPRQIGMTTPCGLFCLDVTAFYAGKVANTLADTKERAEMVFQNVVKFAWDRIPEQMKPKANRDNVRQFDFEGIGSKYMISASKSEPVDVQHITESPYFSDEDRISEAYQMLRRNGIAIEESTAFGVGNGFEQRFTAAWTAQEAGKSYHRKAFFFPWYADPKNNVKVQEGMELKHPDLVLTLAEKYNLTLGQQFFYDQKYDDLDDEVFQFYPSEPREAFLSSGRPVFNLRQIQALQEQHARTGSESEGWTFFREIDGDCSIGVDPAEGLATGDNTAACVLNRDGKQVASLANKYDPEQIAEKLDWICRLIGSKGFDNYVVVEKNNHGHAVIDQCKNYASIRLYRSEDVDAVTQKKIMKYGYVTNRKTKVVAITELRKALKKGEVEIFDYETYQELLFYMYGDRGTMNAVTGKHDDRIIATALAHIGNLYWIGYGDLTLAANDIY